MEEPVLE